MQKLRMIPGSVRPTRGACAELTMTFPVGYERAAARLTIIPRCPAVASPLNLPLRRAGGRFGRVRPPLLMWAVAQPDSDR